MRDEIEAAVLFIGQILEKNNNLTKLQISSFSAKLTDILSNRFQNHWHDQRPSKGQGYRCIRVHDLEPRDPVLEQAARECGLHYEDLQLPTEFTLWVDPREVCFRLGENRNASFCKVASFIDGSSENKAEALDLDRVLEEHEQTRKAELNKFIQATSQRSVSPTERVSPTSFLPALHQYQTVPFTHGSSPYLGGHNNGYHGDTVYYPPATSTPTTMSWGPKWNGPVVMDSRTSPTENNEKTASLISSQRKHSKSSNGKRVKANHQHHPTTLVSGRGGDKCSWVRSNHNAEPIKA